MARRSEHTLEEIKEMILHAAEEIILEQGAQALTVRKVAMRIGYTVGTIYMLFTNMADLILHINARTLAGLAHHLQTTQQRPDEHGIETLAKAYLNYANENLNRWRLIFDHRQPLDTPLPVWYCDRAEAIFDLAEARFTQRGNRAEADRSRAARILWTGVQGLCVLSLTGSAANVKEIETDVSLLVRHFMQGWIGE